MQWYKLIVIKLTWLNLFYLFLYINISDCGCGFLFRLVFGLQPGQTRLISPTVCLPSLVGIKEDNSAIVILVCLLKCITLTVFLKMLIRARSLTIKSVVRSILRFKFKNYITKFSVTVVVTIIRVADDDGH